MKTKNDAIKMVAKKKAHWNVKNQCSLSTRKMIEFEISNKLSLKRMKELSQEKCLQEKCEFSKYCGGGKKPTPQYEW